MIFAVKSIYLAVLGALICSLILAGNSSVFMCDSTIYQLDRAQNILYSKPISDPIDHVIDDHLYVLTRRQLLQININDLKIVDRLPLPYYFNYLFVTDQNLGLIASNEIVLVERRNLSYTGSIGLEPGDNKSLIKNYAANNLPGNRLLIIRDSENRSVLMAIETQTGEIKRKTTINRIFASFYSACDNRFYMFDHNQQLLIYDQELRKINSQNTSIIARIIDQDADGLIVQGNEFLSLLNQRGMIYGIQPIPLRSKPDINVMAILHNKRIILIDPLILRPMKLSPAAIWDRIIDINDPDFFIARDTLQRYYLTSTTTLETSLLTFERPVAYMPDLSPITDTTSLWYVQTGAFVSQANAENNQQIYRLLGIPAMIEKTDMFRVKIGGFLDKETARNFLEAACINGWLTLQSKIPNNENIIFSINSVNYLSNNGIITKEQP